jgi:glycine betaine/proline transport system ATP-binding protein
MDEPFSALDPLIRSAMQAQLIELQDRLRKTIVFVTHDLDEALRLGDRIAILKDGMLSQVGRPQEILLQPADDYVRAFVGDVNRARALTVDAVMKPAAYRLATADIDHALEQMRGWGRDYAYVFHHRAYRGVVTREALAEARERPGGAVSWLHEIADRGPALRPGTALQDALAATLRSDYPVPVVSEDGEFLGILSMRDMAEILATGDRRATGSWN